MFKLSDIRQQFLKRQIFFKKMSCMPSSIANELASPLSLSLLLTFSNGIAAFHSPPSFCSSSSRVVSDDVTVAVGPF